MQESDGTAYQGLPWPDSYRDILPAIRKDWGVDGGLYLNRKLGGGRSGALVYAADIDSATFTGQAILKLDRAPDSASREQLEADRHRRAIADAPDFAAKHLPRLLHTLHCGEQVAVLSTIAGRGLEYAEPWTDCSFERQIQVVHRVSRGLLEDWNGDRTCDGDLRQPWQLLQDVLGRRLDPERGGRLCEFLSERCGLDPLTLSFTVDGECYPNPLAFAVGAGELPDRLGMRMITGRCHGDLHGQNVLVGGPQSSGPDYYLIDLAFYESEQYLFYDHAYFEVAYLLNSRVNASVSDWLSILRQLCRNREPGQTLGLQKEDVGIVELVEALRQEVTDWIGRQEGERSSDMEDQYLLARVAAGLNFTHKRLPDATRQMAFFYAASNLRKYVGRKELDWPTSGPSLTLAPTDRPPDVAAASVSETAPVAVALPAVEMPETGAASDDGETPRLLQRTLIGRFLHELRRRHVVKVAGLYLIVAWLCVQVAVVIKTPLNLPNWSDTLVTVLLALGFPVACVIAWAFELGPQGMQRTRGEERTEKGVARDRGILDYVVAAGIVAIVVFTIGRLGLDGLGEGTFAVDREPPAIAVLPFKNLSTGRTDDTFSDGLTIEIMATLARTGQFRILGQTSTFKFKDRVEDLRKIGKDLGVQYLLEGSVRREGDSLRIEAQLIEADNGFLVWSDAFSEEAKDIFAIQERIASSIGAALERPLGVEAKGLRTGRTENSAAYELFLNAVALVGYRGEGINEQIADGIGLLKRSVAIDPDFAAGWAALSLAYDFGASFPYQIDGRTLTPAVYIKRAAAAAMKAQQINPDLALVHHAIANMQRRARQWSLAEDSYRQAVAEEPNNALALLDYARLLAIVGHVDRAIAMTGRTAQIDPRNPFLGFSAALYAWQANPTADNAEKFLEEFGKQPKLDSLLLRSTMGYLFRSDQVNRLRKLLTDCETCDPSWRDPALSMIDQVGNEPAEKIFETYRDTRFLGYSVLDFAGGADLVLKAFDYYSKNRAFVFQLYLVPWAQVDHVGKAGKFQQIIEDIGLDDYWRERGWPDRCRPLDGDAFECG